jgi:hypothetical protein
VDLQQRKHVGISSNFARNNSYKNSFQLHRNGTMD